MSTSSSTSNTPVQTLPIVTAQATFPAVINEVYSGVIPFEDIWVSCYDHSPPDSHRQATSESLHSKLRVVLDEVDREKVILETREGDVQMSETEYDDKAGHKLSNDYVVSSRSMHILPTRIVVPVQEYADPERSNPQKPHRITAFALAPDKTQFATGFLDGSIFLYAVNPLLNNSASNTKYPTPETYAPPQSTYVERRQVLVSASALASGTSPALLRAHKSTVTSLRFFPSSRVLLSSGADFALQIYPADPIPFTSLPSTPVPTSKRVPSVRTLTGHTRTVTSTEMIGRGRTILSASADGTIRTWNVSRGEEEALIHSASGVGVGVNKIALKLNSSPDTTDDTASGDGVLYAALQDGSFEVFDLKGNQKLEHTLRSGRSSSGTLTVLAVHSDVGSGGPTYFATGTANGIITIYGASYRTLACFRRSDASIEDLEFVPLSSDTSTKLGLAIATGDGLPWIASLDITPSSSAESAPQVKVSVFLELAGGDVDAVRFISVAHTADSNRAEVWTAADDGIVRRYII